MIVSATLCITSNRKFDRVALFIFAAIGVSLFKVLKYLLQSGNKMQYTIFNNLGLTWCRLADYERELSDKRQISGRSRSHESQFNINY